MHVDPETLEYVPVEDQAMSSAAAAYRDGLHARLAERGVVTDEQLPTLSFLGHSVGTDQWTKIETDQGSHWFLTGAGTDVAALRKLAFDFGNATGDDRWRRADGTGWYE